MKQRKIVILGSTGSIGESALKVVRSSGDDLKVVGLTTDRNIEKLAHQIQTFKPSIIGIVNQQSYETFKENYGNLIRKYKLVVYGGRESLEKVATAKNAELVLSGVVGAVGLPALLATLKMGRTVALANKESLIMAGELVTKTAERYGAQIVPVDSEHSAMFQCIQGQEATPLRVQLRESSRPLGENGNGILKIILTASGGPFYRYRGSLSGVSVEKALAHPNWKMGKKITIDSATLMNKGLESIEAHFLFGVPLEKIQIVIHRQSIIHSAVEFLDGSILAQLSHPDMCLPIQYALTYPHRKPCPIKRLDLSAIGRLDFDPPDFHRFPCLELALSAGKSGGTMPTVLSASNEIAVYAFLNHQIRFTDIAKVVEKVLTQHKKISNPNLEEVLESDQWARQLAEKTVSKIAIQN